MSGFKKAVTYPAKKVKMFVGAKKRVNELAYGLRVYSVSGLRSLLRYAFLDVLMAMPEVDSSGYDSEGKSFGCPVTDGLMQDAVKSTSIAFSEIATAAAAFLSDERNVEAMVSRMPAKDRKYLTAILRHGSFSYSEVRTYYPSLKANNIQENRVFAWGGTSALRNQSRLTYMSEFSLSYERFNIPEVIREVLAPHLIPELQKGIRGCESVPEGLTVFSDEEGAIHAFRQLDLLVEGKLFDFDKAKPTAVAIRQLSKAMELKEFFTEDNKNKFSQWSRGRIIAGLLVKPRQISELLPLPASSRIKKLFAINYEFTGLERYALLPQLSGTFTGNNGYNFDSQLLSLRASFVRILHNHAFMDGKWNDVEDIADYIHYVMPDFLTEVSNQYRYNLSLKQGDGRKDRISIRIADSFKYIELPLLQATVFMLAALGLAEIAYDSSLYDVASPFAGIRYMRISPLGRYVFGDTDKYTEAADTHVKAGFELDGRLLMIRMTGESEAMGDILAKFGRPLSSTRYIVSERTFLSDCENIEDVKDKIEMFRRFVRKEPPANWEKFFDKMAANCTAFSHEKNNYKILCVQGNDTELKKILTGDKAVREIITLAEGNRILVPNKDYVYFRQLMHERGYLI